MKNNKLISLLACLLALCCLLTACGGETSGTSGTSGTSDTSGTTDTSDTSGTSGTTQTTQSTEHDPEDMPHDELLLLSGVNISSYKIVYARPSIETTKISNTGKTIKEDLAPYLMGENADFMFDYQSAVRLQQLIKEHFGYELQIVQDQQTTVESKYEILVGQTNRQSTRRMTLLNRDKFATVADFTNTNNYVCMPSTSKSTQYVICGGVYGATWHAIDELEKYIIENKSETKAIDLANAGDLSGQYDFKHIACIGDSITRGSQALPDGNNFGNDKGVAASFGSAATSTYFENYLSYPAALGRALWKDYVVENCGRGWSSMRDYFPNAKDTGPYYYLDTTGYTQCINAGKKDAYDTVLIMLGTNDAGKDGGAKNWTDEHKEEFKAEAKLLIDRIKADSPDATFVLMNAPHRCDGHSENLNDSAMRVLQKDTAQWLLDQGYNVLHYDMEAYTTENLRDPSKTECGKVVTLENKAHEDYYNIKTDTGTPDTTHPNYRGYGKIAEGMEDLLLYILEGGAAPEYMIELQKAA